MTNAILQISYNNKNYSLINNSFNNKLQFSWLEDNNHISRALYFTEVNEAISYIFNFIDIQHLKLNFIQNTYLKLYKSIVINQLNNMFITNDDINIKEILGEIDDNIQYDFQPLFKSLNKITISSHDSMDTFLSINLIGSVENKDQFFIIKNEFGEVIHVLNKSKYTIETSPIYSTFKKWHIA